MKDRAHFVHREMTRLVSAPVAARYLGGERPERFGVTPIEGRRQRLYDLRAIDAALDRLGGLTRGEEADRTSFEDLADEWR